MLLSSEQYFVKVVPEIDEDMRKLCLKPYPGHKKGCPNFRKKNICPPKAPILYDTLDLDSTIYAIYNVFDFTGHLAKMESKHPQWSDRQLRCCLYWQPAARKQLREKIRLFLKKFPSLSIIVNPEAQGVNVTKTMAKEGIHLEWPPETVAYQVVLAGYRRK